MSRPIRIRVDRVTLDGVAIPRERLPRLRELIAARLHDRARELRLPSAPSPSPAHVRAAHGGMAAPAAGDDRALAGSVADRVMVEIAHSIGRRTSPVAGGRDE